ncbi:MAG: STAS domain-containing protein [Herminiimonas sp.]|nr:STAS domain-containing protein [Herminiimonas sp.]
MNTADQTDPFDQNTANAARPVITLGPELSIYEVDSVRQTMLAALAAAPESAAVSASAGTPPLTLHLSQLHECDGAGLQLLLALARSAAEHARALVWNDISPEILERFDRLDVSRLLGTAVARPAP